MNRILFGARYSSMDWITRLVTRGGAASPSLAASSAAVHRSASCDARREREDEPCSAASRLAACFRRSGLSRCETSVRV